jgi:hypothetical protein
MAAGDVRQQFRASSNLTVTNLHGIASSSTLLSGWTSAAFGMASDLDLDFTVAMKLVAESSGLTAGRIEAWLYTQLDDSNWPDLFSAGTEGTEGTCTLHDASVFNMMYPIWSTPTTTTASRIYQSPEIGMVSRIGFAPHRCGLYIAHSMVAALETSGNQVTIKGRSVNVAQS